MRDVVARHGTREGGKMDMDLSVATSPAWTAGCGVPPNDRVLSVPDAAVA